LLVATPDPSQAALMRELHGLLNATAMGSALDDGQRDVLQRAAREFTALAAQRPALIGAAAQLERLRLSGRFDFIDCADCLASLRGATWSLLPQARPGPGSSRRAPPGPLAVDYLQRVELLTGESR
jgi:hypothetical protein